MRLLEKHDIPYEVIEYPDSMRDAEAIAEVHHQAWRGAYAGIIPHKALTAMINRRGSDWWGNAIRRAAARLPSQPMSSCTASPPGVPMRRSRK